jgi:hypothetical protein
MQAAGQRAGAYFSSWGAWAAEKRKTGWGAPASGSAPVLSTVKVEPSAEKSPSVATEPSVPLPTTADALGIVTGSSEHSKTEKAAATVPDTVTTTK